MTVMGGGHSIILDRKREVADRIKSWIGARRIRPGK
jgi:hypothetical protein